MADSFDYGLRITTIVVTLGLGVVGIMWNETVREDNATRYKYEVIKDLLAKCGTKDEAEKSAAQRVMVALKDKKVVSAFSKDLLKDDGPVQATINLCTGWIGQAEASANNAPAKPSTGPGAGANNPPPPLAGGAQGDRWVYLGNYVDADHVWKTQYLDFGAKTPPTSLINGQFRVRQETGALNVRGGAFGNSGEFPPVVAVLHENRQVTVKAVQQWLGSNDWWAKIEATP